MAIQIIKPNQNVFNTIVNPEKMCKYFHTESKASMVERENPIWKWPELQESEPVVNTNKTKKIPIL